VVRSAVPGRGLRFDSEGALKGWENSLTGEQKRVDDGFDDAQSYSFCGIHVIGATIWQEMAHEGVFSIIDEYLHQAQRRKIGGFLYEGYFMDLGTPEAIVEAEKQLQV
jgi:NDP-sugar pyrophosphorylase family protein